jgi:2-C-methyl-D-erythritol 2,4-cyclodiphosphate synthase
VIEVTSYPEPKIRVGTGYDSHRFAKDRPLILGGVTIPHSHGLIGHSDADALAHAITDALLGAAALGDIGQLYPDSDPANKDANSLRLLSDVVALLARQRFVVQQVDATVILERPKLAPHIGEMRARLAEAMRLDLGNISVKAKTNESMGFIGRGEGIAVLAVATVLG